MAWLQLHLPAKKADTSLLEQVLEELGAVSVTLTDAADEPLLEPPPGAQPIWHATLVSALFDAAADADGLIQALRQKSGLPLDKVRIEKLEDQAWERAWLDDFKPMRFGRRLWIIPGNHTPPDPQGVNLFLDPGLAFGTGTHETTALCLEWIDQTAVSDKSILDFGCGSGILAIAALLCGARMANTCDIDPQALIASKSNAEHNGVSDRLALYSVDDLPDTQVDILFANILAAPLIELAEKLASYCKPGTELVLSGILHDQANKVAAAYAPWFNMQPATIKGDWIRMNGQRV